MHHQNLLTNQKWDFSVENSSKCLVSTNFFDKIFKPIKVTKRTLSSYEIFITICYKNMNFFFKISKILLDLEF